MHKKQVRLDIPSSLIDNKSSSINYNLLEGKTVIGLSGYSRSGKDTIGRFVTNMHGFKRVAFGDLLKLDMNKYFKSDVQRDLKSNGVEMNVNNIDFMNPSTQETKEALRPYIIWFAEEIRRLNGAHYWINRAFESIGESNKIVITDIRREAELKIFTKEHKFKSLLVHVSQYELTDSDELTLLAIRRAQELWLFDHTMLIDSRIPDGDYRTMHVKEHIHNLVEKFPRFFL